MTLHRFHPRLQLLPGALAVAMCAALESSPAQAAFIDPGQALSIASGGGWYQELLYNFSTNSFGGVTDPVNFDADLAYTLFVNQWIGIFHYDYSAGTYTTAVYKFDAAF